MPDGKRENMETQTIESQPKGTPQADTSQTSEQTTSQPKTDTSEKLYAGKYKTDSDLEKGYKELESKHGKTVAEKEQQIKEANERYEQLVSQLASNKQNQQTPQEDVYETPEEKLQKEMGTLKQEITQMKLEKITEKFLNDNPDLKGDAEQRIAWQRFTELNQTKGQYWPLDKIMAETAEMARKDIASLKEKVIKEVTESRTEVRHDEIPKGNAVKESVDTSEDETPKDYITWRRKQAEQTRRLV